MAKRPVRKQSTKKAAGPAGCVVVYIHGIGDHPPAADLKLEWDLALFGSDRGDATRMASWSDIVHPKAAAGRGDAQ